MGSLWTLETIKVPCPIVLHAETTVSPNATLSFEIIPMTAAQSDDDLDYATRENLLQYLGEIVGQEVTSSDANFGVRTGDPLDAVLEDLVFLHKKIRLRKCFTVLELGVGFSTLIMADALYKNKQDFDSTANKPFIRCNNPFELHAVDASDFWIERCKEKFEKHSELLDVIKFHTSTVSSTLFNGRICHAYDELPDIIPDFIYLDAPGTADVRGSLQGMTFHSCPDRTVLSVDPCIFEPTLLPGCFIVIDGRTNNARFLKNNFQRDWKHEWLKDRDVTTFELAEEPLGQLNFNMMHYCGLA